MKILAKIKRGSAILEVLIAGTILLIGMTGISLLLLRGYSSARDGTMTVSAAQFAARRAQELTVGGTATLAAMDGGTGGGVVPEDPRFTETWTVTNQSGNGVAAYQVDVVVSWSGSSLDGSRTAAGVVTRDARTHQVTLVVSEAPDGGF